jgi:hypothetical protein
MIIEPTAYEYDDDSFALPSHESLDELFADADFCNALLDALNSNFVMEVEAAHAKH